MRAKDTGIHQFMMLMGEAPITVFGKAKAMHVKLDDVIGWYEREAEHADPQRADECREIATNLRIVKERAGRQATV
jgi:hypothetical protein